MSILASLERAYHRLATENKVPPIGYSNERIDYCVVLKADGPPDGPPVDLRDHSGKKPVAPRHSVPRPEKRTVKRLCRTSFGTRHRIRLVQWKTWKARPQTPESGVPSG